MYADNIPLSTDLKHPFQFDGYNQYVQYLKNRSDLTKKYFLETESVSLTNEYYGINFITQVYINCFLFPDEAVFDKFLDFGIKKDKFHWILPFDNLEKEFQRLEGMGLYVNKQIYLWKLLGFYQIFISKEVFSWSEVYEETRAGKKEVTLTSGIEKGLDRIKRSAKRNYKLSDEQKMYNEMADVFLEIAKETGSPISKIVSMIKGENNKEFLQNWLKESFPYPIETLKSNSFLKKIQRLNNLVFKNKHEPQIKDIGEDEYKGKSLETIHCQFWRKWFFKK